MTLAQTYREEKLISRRSGRRKARIAGRIIGFGLMTCLLVALRTDPQLRAMVDDAAIAVMGKVAAAQGDVPKEDAQAQAEQAQPDAPQEDADMMVKLGLKSAPQPVKPPVRQMPESTVKVHRGGIDPD